MSQNWPRCVVFDYGGVLTGPVRSSINAWVQRDGVEAASLTRLLREWLSRNSTPGNPLHRLERGELEVAAFNDAMASRLTTTHGGRVTAEGLLDRFFAGLRVDEAMVQLVREVRGTGLQTVLLSNSWGTEYPRELLDELFDVQVISSEVGMRKPDAEIFHLTANLAGVAVEEMLLIDDGAPNVASALAIGMMAHLHIDATSTRRVMEEALPGRLQ
jgi:putative hydrolase of the HAD superfamily